MAEPPVDPEQALPWQKLAAALSDLLRVEPPAEASRHGLDAHEGRAQAVADMLTRKGLLDPAEMQARMEALAASLAGDKDHAHPKTRFSNARPNDIGGMPGGRVDPASGRIEAWERLVVALGAVLGQRHMLNLHERRRAVEDLGDDYHRLAYFERMVQGQVNLLCQKGVLTREEVEHKIGALKDRR
jgi:hypothetical protein